MISDSLEEISPELSKKLEKEEEEKISFANTIKIIDEKGYIKKNRSFKMRNSSLNLGFVNYKKTFFSEKDNKTQDDLNDKKTYSNKKNILLYDSKIIEEDEEKEVEEKNSILEEKSISKIGTENINKIIIEESPDNSNNSNLKFKLSKSKDFTSNSSGKKSRLLDEIKNLSQIINVYLFESDESIKINIYPSNTVKEIKAKIIHELKMKKYNLINTSTDAYDLRPIDEEGDSPDMDFPPLRDYVRVRVAGYKACSFSFFKKSRLPRKQYNQRKIFLYE